MCSLHLTIGPALLQHWRLLFPGLAREPGSAPEPSLSDVAVGAKPLCLNRSRGKVYSQPRKSLLTIFSTPAEKRGKVAPARTSGPQAASSKQGLVGSVGEAHTSMERGTGGMGGGDSLGVPGTHIGNLTLIVQLATNLQLSIHTVPYCTAGMTTFSDLEGFDSLQNWNT